MTIHPLSLVSPDCEFGPDSDVGPYVCIGHDPVGWQPPATFGARATLRSHTVVYRGVTVGDDFATGHGVLIRQGTTAGDDVSIGSHTVVEHSVRIASNVRIHSNCFIPELTQIDEGAWLGPGVICTNAKFPNRPDTKRRLEGVHIEAGAVIGAGVVLLPGIVVGSRALVGAGCIVTSDVPEGVVVRGTVQNVVSDG